MLMKEKTTDTSKLAIRFLGFSNVKNSLADLGERKGRVQGQHFIIFTHFSAKIGQIVGWRPFL